MRKWVETPRAILLSPPLFLRIAVSLLLIGTLILLVDTSDLKKAVDVPPWALAISVAIFALSQVTASIKLWHLLRTCSESASASTSFLQVLHATFVSFFASNFFPGTVGGDFAKGVLLIARGLDKMTVVSAVIVDRLTNLAAMIALLTISGLMLNPLDGSWGLILGVLSLLMIAVALLLISASSPTGVRLTGRLLDPVFAAVVGFRRRVKAWLTSPLTISIVAATSLAGFLLSVAAQLLLLPFLEIQIDAALLVFAICAGSLAGLVPLSLNGIGVQEAGMVAVLVGGGVDANAAALVAIVSRVIALGASFLGGGAMVMEIDRRTSR